MKKGKKTFLVVFLVLLLLPATFAAIGSQGNYNSQTKFSFVGYDSSSSVGHNSRGSNQITGSFSIGATYSGRFGILKYCGNSIIDSGETCDSTNLDGETCASRGYSSGTLACNADCSGFDTSSCTSHIPSVRENIPSGTDSGAAPSPTKFASTTSVNIGKGELVALTTAQGASFDVRGVGHSVDIKEIGGDYVRLWVYSDPIEVVLKIGKRANVDLDSDGFADVRIELRGITNNNAFLYFKELKGYTKITIPKGEKVVIEEQFELPKITLLPKIDLENAWLKSLQDFEKFVRANVDYWIKNIKTKKAWWIPSVILAGVIVLGSIISFSFFIRRKVLKKREKIFVPIEK